MNQGKLEVVTQEMATVNVNILGISELKWTEMGVFNSDDHYIYYCGQESLRRNGVAIMVTKRVRRDSSPSQRFSERTILHSYNPVPVTNYKGFLGPIFLYNG